MKIGFIFNAQIHQFFHSLPIACALSRDFPEIETTLLPRNPAHRDYLRALAKYYDAGRLKYQTAAPPFPWSLASPDTAPPKFLTLLWNLRTFSQFDALVMPERTSLKLRRMGLRQTKFIHTTHGAGDDERDWDTRLLEFDLVLLPGRKRRDRLLQRDLIRPGHYYVNGYNKFDLVTRMEKTQKPLFNNSRKTVLYNPHHNMAHSSWHKIGHQVLDYFSRSSQFNLIFAPHIRLFADGNINKNELLPYANLQHLLIDTCSPRSVDMTYSLAADIYLGDWSSQVYEFLLHPRPVVFLNPHQHEWRGKEDYLWWTLGRVTENISEMHAALTSTQAWQEEFEAAQKTAFNYTFASFQQAAPERAASAIVKFMKNGRIEDDAG